MYDIIEDCSPYFIRFTHPGLNELISYCKNIADNIQFGKRFSNFELSKEDTANVLRMSPLSKQFDIGRAALFYSPPGLYYRAHKDGKALRMGFNYSIRILDEECVTSWYSDEDLKIYQLDYLNGRSREASCFRKENHLPLKSMTARKDECVLFNTDIFHDFDNSKSKNSRILLALRLNNPENMYFDNTRKIIEDGYGS